MNTPLSHRMSNGSTVKDWLGTASISAAGAATILTRARGGDVVNADALQNALDRLKNAAYEVEAVLAVATNRAGASS